MSTYSKILKGGGNPNHDPTNGEFSRGDGSKAVNTSSSTAPTREKPRKPLTMKQVEKEFAEIDHLLVYPRPKVADFYKATKGKMSIKSTLEALFGKDDLHKNPGKILIHVVPPQHGSEVSIMAHNGSYAYGSKLPKGIARTFSYDNDTVYHGILALDNNSQAGGVIKKMYKEILPEYQKAGFSKIKLTANMEMGAYAWAKYGFKASNPRECVTTFKDGLDTLVNSHKKSGGALSPHANKELDGINELLEKHRDDPSISHILSDLKTPHLDAELDKTMKTTFPEGKDLTLAKAAFYNQEYDGVLDFNDPVSMHRNKTYLNR